MSASFVLNALLSPDGSVHPVDYDNGEYNHYEVAMRLTGIRDNDAALDNLCERGWYILSASRPNWVSTWARHEHVLTQAQEDTLWDMYMDARSHHPTVYIERALTSLRNVLNISVQE